MGANLGTNEVKRSPQVGQAARGFEDGAEGSNKVSLRSRRRRELRSVWIGEWKPERKRKEIGERLYFICLDKFISGYGKIEREC